MSKSWSAKELDLLRQFVEQGLTAKEIAAALKTRTRNAVIGECHRRSIQLHHRPTRFGSKRAPVEARPVRLADLKDHHCRWPIDSAGRGLDSLYCGRRKVDGQSYCPRHCGIAYPAWRGDVDDEDDVRRAAE